MDSDYGLAVSNYLSLQSILVHQRDPTPNGLPPALNSHVNVPYVRNSRAGYCRHSTAAGGARMGPVHEWPSPQTHCFLLTCSRGQVQDRQ